MSERDAWISEMWACCPEVPREEREVKRALDAIAQANLAGMAVDAPVEMAARRAS